VAARAGLQDIPGIGKDLAGKIQEYLQSGALEYLEGCATRFRRASSR